MTAVTFLWLSALTLMVLYATIRANLGDRKALRRLDDLETDSKINVETHVEFRRRLDSLDAHQRACSGHRVGRREDMKGSLR